MNISGSRAISLLPFGYFAATRIAGLRDLAYLVGTSWLPAVWLLVRLAELDIARSALTFAAGYIAFISVYEIGYLVNDVWDAKRSDGGRARAVFRTGLVYLLVFVAIRLGLWAAIAVLTGWITNPLWLVSYGVLAITLAQHNLVHLRGLRLASFYELATLRFMLPILASIAAGSLAPVLLIALVLYAFPRFLAYMESKDLLRLEMRRAPSFGFFLMLSFQPLLLFSAYLLDANVLIELSAYFLAIHAAWWAIAAFRRTA